MNDAERETLERRIDELCQEVESWRMVAASRTKQCAEVNEVNDALQAENAKLRELVSGLEYCAGGFVCESCPLYDPSGTNHRRCESLERELGIEVDE